MIPTAAFIGYLVFETIAVPLYIRIICVLCTNPEFKGSPLHRFVALIGIMDLSHYLLVLLLTRLPMFGPSAPFFATWTTPSRLLSVFVFFVFFLRYFSTFLHIVISANRLTAVWMPMRHAKIWRRNWHLIAFVLFFISFAIPFDRLLSASHFVALIPQRPEYSGYTPVVAFYDLYNVDQNLLTVVISGVGILCCLFLNGATFVKIKALSRSGTIATSDQRIELNLFLMTLWMTLSMVFMAIYQTLLFSIRKGALAASFFQQDSNSASDAYYLLFLQEPWLEDLTSLTEPFAILFTSEIIRRAVFPSAIIDRFTPSVFNGSKITNKGVINVVGPSTQKRVSLMNTSNYGQNNRPTMIV